MDGGSANASGAEALAPYIFKLRNRSPISEYVDSYSELKFWSDAEGGFIFEEEGGRLFGFSAFEFRDGDQQRELRLIGSEVCTQVFVSMNMLCPDIGYPENVDASYISDYFGIPFVLGADVNDEDNLMEENYGEGYKDDYFSELPEESPLTFVIGVMNDREWANMGIYYHG